MDPNLKSSKCSKVGALAHFLKQNVPYIKINSKPKFFEEVLRDSDILISDVIVIAVGSPTLSLAINRKLKTIGVNKVIFCWNEAASLGGHSIALDLTQSCYECLYSDEENFKMECELNLLCIGQNISKNLTGCAGVFTPFSYLDSSRTAALAVKQCIDMLLYDKHSVTISWKGDNHAQMEVTDRFVEMPLQEEVRLGRKKGCGVCNE